MGRAGMGIWGRGRGMISVQVMSVEWDGYRDSIILGEECAVD